MQIVPPGAGRKTKRDPPSVSRSPTRRPQGCCHQELSWVPSILAAKGSQSHFVPTVSNPAYMLYCGNWVQTHFQVHWIHSSILPFRSFSINIFFWQSVILFTTQRRVFKLEKAGNHWPRWLESSVDSRHHPITRALGAHFPAFSACPPKLLAKHCCILGKLSRSREPQRERECHRGAEKQKPQKAQKH